MKTLSHNPKDGIAPEFPMEKVTQLAKEVEALRERNAELEHQLMVREEVMQNLFSYMTSAEVTKPD